MCGIAGIVDLNRDGVAAAVLEGMCARLAHRGPDDQGVQLLGPAALGQRRLRIIDLAGGHQPMANEDGTVWITFNGEIYNYKDLRSRLEERGHRFANHSDTEAIVHAYEEYGPQAVEHLRGMFAFAIWDQRQEQLFLARDRLGKKPLVYAQAGGQFVFASELQALLQHPGVRREVDPTALEDYLTYGYVPAPKTIFRGIYKLPPAHHLTLRLGAGADGTGPRVERYWQLAYGPKLVLDEREAAEGLLEVLTEAVRLRLVADVPVGALLSGGIDSGTVVALMSRLCNRPVKTFSVGFDERDFDELPYARLVAERYGTEHHELVARPDVLEVLPTLVRHYGEPYADSSALPSYYVARLTRQHVTVALNGDGGDECFAGYERYLGSLGAESYRKLPAPLRRWLIEPLSRLIPNALPRRNRLRQLKRFLEVASQPLGQRYTRWLSYLTPQDKEELYTPEFRRRLEEHDGGRWLTEQVDAAAAAGLSPLDAILAVDVQTYLPNDLLVKMDIATMANSLEARSPFLDHKVMEFAARLPGCYKVQRTTLKYLLKRVAQDLLPPAVSRRRKMGFGVPVGYWMRSTLRSLVEETLLSPQARIREYIQQAGLRRFVSEHLEGRQDHAYPIWALLWLEMWHREFLP